MKVIVKKTFRDKVTGKIYKVGDIVNFSKARFEEIQKKGEFIEVAAKESNKLSESKNK